MQHCSVVKQCTHTSWPTCFLFFFVAWLTFSNNKCLGKENMLLKFNVSILSVSVRMSSELGNQSLFVHTGTSGTSYSRLLVVCSAGNRVGCVCTSDGGVCIQRHSCMECRIQYEVVSMVLIHFTQSVASDYTGNVTLINEHTSTTLHI